MLSFKNQNCSLTLREGIEEYNDYLRANGKEVLAQLRDSSIVQDHDVTHVIFGLDTTLEEESLLDTWVLWCCSYRLSHLMSYSKQPEIKDLYKKLLREVGIFKFLKLLINVFQTKFKIIFKHKKLMKKKWPFEFPEAYYDRKIFDLREEYGIEILKEEDKQFKKLNWSGAIKN